jgi:hypothetical protein
MQPIDNAAVTFTPRQLATAPVRQAPKSRHLPKSGRRIAGIAQSHLLESKLARRLLAPFSVNPAIENV